MEEKEFVACSVRLLVLFVDFCVFVIFRWFIRFEMAARQSDWVGREYGLEDFNELLRDTDSEDEGDEVETEYHLKEETEEQEAVYYDMPVYMDQELDPLYYMPELEPKPECVDPPPTILGLYTQEGVKVPLPPTASSPMFMENPSNSTSSVPHFSSSMPHPSSSVPHPSSSAPVVTQASSPLRAQLSPENVVITLREGDTDAQGDQFHLADEHLQFEQEAEPVERLQPVRGRGSPRKRARGSPRGGRRGRGQGRAGGRAGEPQWQKGERCIEVHMNDDDVPEDLRAEVMRMMNARLATRERAISRARRQLIADGEVHEDEEWMDADDGQDEVLFAGGGSSPRFEWLPMDNYKGEREPFLPQKTGPVVKSENAYEAFRHYWDDSVLLHIVTETNRYAQWLAESSVSFRRDWYDTNIHEILILFSFWMMLGIIRMPSTKSCFTLNPLLQTNIFRKLFSRRRYETLCRALHFNDNSNKPIDNSDRLFSFGPILDHLNLRFKEAYVPSQNICIDESLTLWKGNLKFRQCIRTKAARFGVKTFELCESSTGYLWSFFVYIGKATTYDPTFPSTLMKSTATVLTLIRPLLDKGYTLFMDNWFNSPLLARFLKTRKTDCVGTLRANCRNVPPLISLCKLKEGHFTARHSGDITVMAYQDKKRKVATISTYHGIQQGRMEATSGREAQFKPQVIVDYNKGMGGVDRKDQMLEPYLLERKRCSKWNMKVFKRLLNCSILNARIVVEGSTSVPKKHLVFRLELVDEIIKHHHEHMPHARATPGPSSSSPRKGLSPRKLKVAEHWPKKLDEVMKNGCRVRRRCTHCTQTGVTRRTSFVCCVCDVPLCLEPCFKLYHNDS
ncbi:hypothetical protein PYW07_010480 [Mythimna separata]|uniref:PiggyBac transposable element-derived protein domain-containing protein n=1 Tax=Mythimna separata TaxID=271217 RepID=A0AAD7YAP2_MYTSE|nr:hypothetical protein PYW07_010480 [Mythimna separata]